ncbi:hypothetical protein B0O99DRAFT_681149 [Bisporella sp. PMI_857]|nr:hypothetical protein B0O99DRAFT_681149 [Bisporella sp. PMI_857]
MGLTSIFQKKPYSAISVHVENYTSEDYEVDDIGNIPELVEIVKLQSTGPAEAARAIRKKLKYGNVHRQLRALTILDGLIQNGGERFQRVFADEMLLERLRVCGTSELSDPQVKAKCNELFRSWAAQYKNSSGLKDIASLHRQLPQRKQVVTQERSKVVRETENPFDADEEKEEKTSPKPSPATIASSKPGSSSHPPSAFFTTNTVAASKRARKEKEKEKKDGKKKSKKFDYEAEKPVMQNCIAQSSMASTNLLNALRLINREREQISENKEAVTRFEECKLLRRKILRYIQLIEKEEYLGALLDANDRLVESLRTFEDLDKSIDADSDSDDEMALQAHLYKMSASKGKEVDTARQLAGLSISPPKAENHPPQPLRPVQQLEEDAEEEDENDPFGDRNAIETPATERGEPDWGLGRR